MTMDIYQIWSIIVDIIILGVFVSFVFLMPVEWKLWPKETKIIMIVILIFWSFSLIIHLTINDPILRSLMTGISSAILGTFLIIVFAFFYRRLRRENKENG